MRVEEREEREEENCLVIGLKLLHSELRNVFLARESVGCPLTQSNKQAGQGEREEGFYMWHRIPIYIGAQGAGEKNFMAGILESTAIITKISITNPPIT